MPVFSSETSSLTNEVVEFNSICFTTCPFKFEISTNPSNAFPKSIKSLLFIGFTIFIS
ncbi:MAG: hypothetical protein ACJAZ3_000897 [Sphingobacteriales bacterium]|jgi:hypothetical protein